jgi:hypothetical protein
MASFRNINEYYTYLFILITQSGHASGSPPLLLDKKNPRDLHQGRISADAIRFKDGARLRFYEELEFDGQGAVARAEYSIGYYLPANNSPLFRYDRDPQNVRPVVHEECHLHIDSVQARG